MYFFIFFMKPVRIYTMDYCPYCVFAKKLLESLEVPYTEYDKENNMEAIEKIMQEQNYTSFPMIFIGDTFIGGFANMHKMHLEKKLMPMLESDDTV